MKYLWFGVPVALLWMSSYDRWRTVEPIKAVQARAQIDNFGVALGHYKSDVGGFPSTAEGLQALRVNPGRNAWHGPYLSKDVPLDPWGMPYVYQYPGEHGSGPDIASYGADRQPGGEGISADIVSWRRPGD